MQLAAISVLDILSIGSVTTLLGLGMTFLVLTVLVGCIFFVEFLIKKISLLFSNLKKNKETKIESDSQAIEQQSTDSQAVESTIDENTAKAIKDAVALFAMQEDKDKKPHNNITIKSIVELD